jgi:hypothetical protein
MVAADRRAGLDANVLIAGIMLPRWPHEVMRAAIERQFRPVLPEQVVTEARRHLTPVQSRELDRFISQSDCERLAMPPPDVVANNLDLVRSAKDVAIALALLDGRVDVFVTSDRDFTDEGATAARFNERVRTMLPPVFLREVLGWSSGDLEAIRSRTWEDIARGRDASR